MYKEQTVVQHIVDAGQGSDNALIVRDFAVQKWHVKIDAVMLHVCMESRNYRLPHEYTLLRMSWSEKRREGNAPLVFDVNLFQSELL
jgi:hypothetical protein